MDSIKYRYACNSAGNIVDIDTVPKNWKSSEIFTCLSCSRALSPVLGIKRRKHFRHKTDFENNCSPETYLHKLAKQTFFETYNSCIENKQEFFIVLKMKKICTFYGKDFNYLCDLGEEAFHFDLTRYFPTINLETRVGNFIPDLLLSNERGDKIFIEIAVTHLSSQEKTQSNYRIIELDVKDEADIEVIKSCLLSEEQNVKFLNFNKESQGDFCSGKCINGLKPNDSCSARYNLFVLYQDNKTRLFKNIGLDEVIELQESPLILEWEFVIVPDSQTIRSIYIQKIIQYYYDEKPIKNCFLCRYQRNSFYGYEIYCRFLRKSGNSHMATQCNCYWLSPKFLK